jgi:hypothetical protein
MDIFNLLCNTKVLQVFQLDKGLSLHRVCIKANQEVDPLHCRSCRKVASRYSWMAPRWIWFIFDHSVPRIARGDAE